MRSTAKCWRCAKPGFENRCLKRLCQRFELVCGHAPALVKAPGFMRGLVLGVPMQGTRHIVGVSLGGVRQGNVAHHIGSGRGFPGFHKSIGEDQSLAWRHLQIHAARGHSFASRSVHEHGLRAAHAQLHLHITDKPGLGAEPLNQQIGFSPAAPNMGSRGFQDTGESEAVVGIHVHVAVDG